MASIYELPFRHDTFDHAACVGVLHHLPSTTSRRLALEAISTLTRQQLLVSVCRFDQPNTQFPTQDALIYQDNKTIPIYYHLFTPHDLQELVQSISHEKDPVTASDHYLSVIISKKTHISIETSKQTTTR